MAYGQSVHTILYIPYPCHWFLYWIRCWKANWLHGYFVLLCFTTSALYACLGSRALKGKALTRQSRKFRTACAVSLDMWVIDNSDIITVHVQTVSFFIYLFIYFFDYQTLSYPGIETSKAGSTFLKMQNENNVMLSQYHWIVSAISTVL